MRIYRKVIIHFIGKIIPAISQLCILVLGVRLLGVEEYGKYNLVYSACMIISSLMVGWIQQSTLRFFFETDSTGVRKDFEYYRLAFPASIAAFLMALVFGLAYFQLSWYYVLVIAVFTGLFSIFLVTLTMRQVNFNPVSFAVTESFFYAFSTAIFLSGTLIFDYRNSVLLFEGMVLALIAWFIFRLTILKSRGESFSYLVKPPSKDFFVKMLAYGVPITIWLLISNFYNVFDRFIIKYYLGFDAVGMYGSVYDLVFKIGGLMTLPVLLTFHPAISQAWNSESFHKAKSMIQQAVLYELAILILIFGVAFIFHEKLTTLLFGKNLEGTNSLFLPVALSAILWHVSLILQKPLEFNFRQRLMITGILLTVILNGVLNVLTVPQYGFVMAAYNTLISSAFYFLFVIYFSFSTLKSKLSGA